MSMVRIFPQSVINVNLLKRLKGQCLSSKKLHTVFCALTVSLIVYALPAWGGLLTADLIGKIDGYLFKAIR